MLELYTMLLQFQHVFILTLFSTSASSRRFHLLLGAEELAALVQYIPITLIFVNETHTIMAKYWLNCPLNLWVNTD